MKMWQRVVKARLSIVLMISEEGKCGFMLREHSTCNQSIEVSRKSKAVSDTGSLSIAQNHQNTAQILTMIQLLINH